jgi:hypothetical protein
MLFMRVLNTDTDREMEVLQPKKDMPRWLRRFPYYEILKKDIEFNCDNGWRSANNGFHCQHFYECMDDDCKKKMEIKISWVQAGLDPDSDAAMDKSASEIIELLDKSIKEIEDSEYGMMSD